MHGALYRTRRSELYLFAIDGRTVDGWEGRGPVVMAVDTLPSELPREASASFGEMLLPFVPAIAAADFNKPFDDLDLPLPIKRAIIVHKGVFGPEYEYMSKFVQGFNAKGTHSRCRPDLPADRSLSVGTRRCRSYPGDSHRRKSTEDDRGDTRTVSGCFGYHRSRCGGQAGCSGSGYGSRR